MSSGELVYVPSESHGCSPPMEHVEFVRVSEGKIVNHTVRWVPGSGQAERPAFPRGSVWRCDCGRYWTVGGGILDRWRPATWWERRRARRRARTGEQAWFKPKIDGPHRHCGPEPDRAPSGPAGAHPAPDADG